MAEAAPANRGTTRTKARKRALDILFEADLRELPATEILADHTEWADPAVRPFSAELVTGVAHSISRLDAELDRGGISQSGRAGARSAARKRSGTSRQTGKNDLPEAGA